MKDEELSRYIVERQQELFAAEKQQQFHLIEGDYRNGEADFALGKAIASFARAVFDKAKRAQIKYNYGPLGWATPDWKEQLQKGLAEHILKGDPRDVGVYAVFAHFHGWPTAEKVPAQGFFIGPGNTYQQAWAAALAGHQVRMPDWPTEMSWVFHREQQELLRVYGETHEDWLRTGTVVLPTGAHQLSEKWEVLPIYDHENPTV